MTLESDIYRHGLTIKESDFLQKVSQKIIKAFINQILKIYLINSLQLNQLRSPSILALFRNIWLKQISMV